MDDPENVDRFFRIAQENEVGSIAMKVIARRKLIRQGLDIRQLLPYVRIYPMSTEIVCSSDVVHLDESVRVVSSFNCSVRMR